MDDTFKSKFKNVTRRLSRKGSYEVGMTAPTFKVKALCLEGISVNEINNTNSNQAVDLVFGSVGSLEAKNKQDVVMKVSIKEGIQILSRKSRKELFRYKIHQVGYCNVDKRYPQLFVFIAAGKEKVDLKCHVFLCDDVPKARAICLTFAKTFQNSFQNWQKSKEMTTPDLNLNDRLVDRRRSADVVQIPNKSKLEKRRASDFVTTGGLRRLNIRRSSADAVHRESSDEETYDNDANQIFEDILSTSAENGTCSLLRRQSTDWDAIANDEEVQRKMQGDLIVWE